MSVPTPNQSFLTREIEYKVAACMAAMLHDQGAPIDSMPGVWRNPNLAVFAPTGWRKDAQALYFKRNQRPGRGLASITFSNVRFSSDSTLNYGTKKVLQNVEATVDGKTKVVRNDTDDALHVAYEEAVGLVNAFASRVTKGMTLDMSVDSTTTVKGEYAGISAEESLSLHFGVSKTEEQEHEKSEEGSHDESLAIEFDAAARSHYLVSVTKEHETTEQSFEIDGVIDFDIDIHCHGGKFDHIKLVGVAGLEQFVRGWDTNYSEMSGYWDRCFSRVKNGINWILNPANRRMQVSGVNTASLESNEDFKVELLGSELPPGLEHLPQVSAEDLD